MLGLLSLQLKSFTHSNSSFEQKLDVVPGFIHISLVLLIPSLHSKFAEHIITSLS